jgi:hypothetical protein
MKKISINPKLENERKIFPFDENNKNAENFFEKNVWNSILYHSMFDYINAPVVGKDPCSCC